MREEKPVTTQAFKATFTIEPRVYKMIVSEDSLNSLNSSVAYAMSDLQDLGYTVKDSQLVRKGWLGRIFSGFPYKMVIYFIKPEKKDETPMET